MTGRKAFRATGTEKPPWHEPAGNFRPENGAQKLAPILATPVRHARWRDATACPDLCPEAGLDFLQAFLPVRLATVGLVGHTSGSFFFERF